MLMKRGGGRLSVCNTILLPDKSKHRATQITSAFVAGHSGPWAKLTQDVFKYTYGTSFST